MFLRKHRSFAWKLLQIVKGVFQATKYQGDTALTIPPFFKNAGRGKERIWGEEIATPQPTVTSENYTSIYMSLNIKQQYMFLIRHIIY